MIIPNNGVLILNEDFDRHVNYKYFLIDSLGNKKEIPNMFFFNDENKDGSFVKCCSSGSFAITNKEKRIKYSDFYISNKDSIIETSNLSSLKFDLLAWQLVNQCRQ